MIDSPGDRLSLHFRWLETHEWKPAPCPDCEGTDHEHDIAVCAVCEWPPATDGRCRCDLEKHA